MKLISLNVWGGRVYEPLMGFIKEHADSTDIFCFQEVHDTTSEHTTIQQGDRANHFQEMRRALPNHSGLFAAAFSDITADFSKTEYPLGHGLATFVRRAYTVRAVRDVVVSYTGPEPKLGVFGPAGMPRNMLVAVVEISGGKNLTIGNVHGVWIPNFGKGDAPVRLQQSANINAALATETMPQILCGDLNLDPHAESLRLLEEDRRNLIKEYDITDTRTEFYPANKHSRYADYTFVSPGIDVTSFEVPNLPISDHRPMILEFDV